MGQTFLKVFNNFKFATASEKDNFETVTEKFDQYFEPKKNTIAIITKFQARVQNRNETISHYITEIKELAKQCNFGDKEDEMVHVQISNGISDPLLKKQLWDSDLSLDDLVRKCQLYELRENTLHEINAVHANQK